MKLRNKKTGEIIEKYPDGFVINSGEQIRRYDSLAELNEEWEDLPEEPKEIYFISNNGQIHEEDGHDRYREARKEIGNYFETKEEAEKAVERLRAWKRLKDKGFRFEGWDNTDHTTIHNFSLFVAIEDLESINKDLDLLFGGEE